MTQGFGTPVAAPGLDNWGDKPSNEDTRNI